MTGIFSPRNAALSALMLGAVALSTPPPAAAQQLQPQPDAGQPQPTLTTAPVTLTTPAGDEIVLEAEIAQTPRQRAMGMMFREHIDDDKGMLFLFPFPQPSSFWMRNTLIPLDILFISPEGEVITIHAEATPLDLTPLPSGGVILSVLEIRGGLAAELGVTVGARVASPALSPLWPPAE